MSLTFRCLTLYVLDLSDIIIRTIHFSYRQFLDTSLDADVPNIVRNVPKCQNVRVGQDIINCSRECKTKNEHMSFKMKINSFGSRYNMSLSQSRVQLWQDRGFILQPLLWKDINRSNMPVSLS